MQSLLERVQHTIFKLEFVLIQVETAFYWLILHILFCASTLLFGELGEKETLFHSRADFLWIFARDALRDSEAFDRMLSHLFAEEKAPAFDRQTFPHELNFSIFGTLASRKTIDRKSNACNGTIIRFTRILRPTYCKLSRLCVLEKIRVAGDRTLWATIATSGRIL